MAQQAQLPVIDIGPFLTEKLDLSRDDIQRAVSSIGSACRTHGFFYITNHGVSDVLQDRLEAAAKAFFSQPVEVKRQIEMSRGGKAWRGYFSVGEELTSGLVDQKEGLYFGEEREASDPRPMHGPNLFPAEEVSPDLRESVHEYMESMVKLGHVLIRAIGLSLGLDENHFGGQFAEPLQLFRIFNYPPFDAQWGEDSWAVGEHTDYGYLTILKQDSSGGLQVRDVLGDGWLDAPPLPGTFVVNLGDALEHNSGGLIRATPHRVQQRRGASSGRLSFPFFFDPSFDVPMQSVVPYLSEELQAEAEARRNGHRHRWDGRKPEAFQGTYGEYVLSKVSKVFPLLASSQAISEHQE